MSGGPTPPLAAHALLLLLTQVTTLLFAAVLLGRLAIRVGMPPVAGELVAGVLLGPSVLAHVLPGPSTWLFPPDPNQFHLLDAVGQVGVLLLVATAGTEIDGKLLRRRGLTAASISVLGLIVPLAGGIAVSLVLPATFHGPSADRGLFAAFVGVAMSVSAIPVIAKTLSDMGLIHRRAGQLTLFAATLDDVVGWLMLSVVAAAAADGLSTGALWWSLLRLVCVAAGILVLGRLLARAALGPAGRPAPPERCTAPLVMIVLASAAYSQAMGVEGVFGAFLAGLALRSAGLLDAQLAPTRIVTYAVLAPLFLATAGLRVDLTALTQPATLGAAVAVVLVGTAGKIGGGYLGARFGRLGHWEALAIGAGMNARGVVGIVIASVGLQRGIVSGDAYTTIVLLAVVTSLTAPPLLKVTMRRVPHCAEEATAIRAGDASPVDTVGRRAGAPPGGDGHPGVIGSR